MADRVNGEEMVARPVSYQFADSLNRRVEHWAVCLWNRHMFVQRQLQLRITLEAESEIGRLLFL